MMVQALVVQGAPHVGSAPRFQLFSFGNLLLFFLILPPPLPFFCFSLFIPFPLLLPPFFPPLLPFSPLFLLSVSPLLRVLVWYSVPVWRSGVQAYGLLCRLLHPQELLVSFFLLLSSAPLFRSCPGDNTCFRLCAALCCDGTLARLRGKRKAKFQGGRARTVLPPFCQEGVEVRLLVRGRPIRRPLRGRWARLLRPRTDPELRSLLQPFLPAPVEEAFVGHIA
mmetsp:Transcript_107091/g.301383  ORF Transcript_107091/g.301383 Transcript_107091/m.301383 type:complete len:223 (+) Transcript_107091:305-973(+)